VTSLPQLLKEGWALVEERREQFARYVFTRLFLVHPAARDLFPASLDMQYAQLVSAIVGTIPKFDDAPALRAHVRTLAQQYRRYRFTGEQLDVLGEALLAGVRMFGASGWSTEYEHGWAQAYRLVRSAILDSAIEAPDNPASRDVEVVAHRRIGTDRAVLTVAPFSTVPFLPGQHVPVESPHYPGLWREYGIANAPRPDNTLDLHIRAVGGGLVSGALVRRTEVGDRLRLADPGGAMTLDRRSSRDIVAVAVDTGLAQILALVDELTRYNRTRWVHLFVAGRTREDLYDLYDLRRLAARFPWLSVVPVLSDDPGFATAEHGTVAEVVLRYGPWPDHDCFVAGPVPAVRPILRVLCALRVPEVRMHYAAFESSPGVRSAGRNSGSAAA
jgi:NAD(P)H-flavin reductase/hemoglobin-like flavoprotein